MSLRRRLASFRFAFQGLKLLVRTQPNARIHLTLAVAAVSGGWFFQISRVEWMAVAVCMGMVLALEAVNTALENLTDLVSPEFHPLAGKAKDLAAGAVLLAAMAALTVGLLVFVPKIWKVFQ